MKKHRPWNKGKKVGLKPALTLQQVQTIKSILDQRSSLRDQALFSLAIDSCLRWIDLVQLRVSDVMIAGQLRTTISVQPTKTSGTSGVTVVFEPTEATKELLRKLVFESQKLPYDFLFAREDRAKCRGLAGSHLSVRSYTELVKHWVRFAGLEPALYGTHSLRRTRPAYVYSQTGNLRACQLMLGHASISTTQNYLGIEVAEVLEISRHFPM